MSIHRIGGNAKDGGAKAAADLIENKPGKHSDGGGLYLQVASPGQASWVWRRKPKGGDKTRGVAPKLRKEAHQGRDPFPLLPARRARPVSATFVELLAKQLPK